MSCLAVTDTVVSPAFKSVVGGTNRLVWSGLGVSCLVFFGISAFVQFLCDTGILFYVYQGTCGQSIFIFGIYVLLNVVDP
jgi:hypothetical protein